MLFGQACGILGEEEHYLDTVHSKSMPSWSESTKQLADPKRDRECLAMSAPFISFNMARALLLTSCLKVLQRKQGQQDALRHECLQDSADKYGHGAQIGDQRQ